MREQKTKAQAKKKTNYEIIPTPCPHSQPDMNQPPTIIHNSGLKQHNRISSRPDLSGN